jgi:transcription antitermination factor NusG
LKSCKVFNHFKDLKMNRNWYAVYTKPQSEKKVVALLSKKKIENFCPHKRVITGYGNKRRMLYEPLFPTFVFVYVSAIEMNEVRKINDLLNFVYWLGQPAVIKTAEIENIAHFNGQYYNIMVEKSPVNAAGMVRIINEPGRMTDTDTGIISVKNTKVKLILPSLGFTMYAETNIETETPSEYGIQQGAGVFM